MKIYITTHSTSVHYAHQVKECLKDSPIEYYFVYGRNNPVKLEPYLEFDFEESYWNLTDKTYYIAEHFLKNNTDGKLVKIDDDTFLDPQKLLKYESWIEDYMGCFVNSGCQGQFNREQYIKWYRVKKPEYKELKQRFPIQYAEGGFYILSSKACEEVVNHKNWFCNLNDNTIISEDTLVGICLQDQKFLKKDLRIHKETYFDIVKDFASVHPVNLILFAKLRSMATDVERLEFLKKHSFLNKLELSKMKL